jgi:hypothetical protein
MPARSGWVNAALNAAVVNKFRLAGALIVAMLEEQPAGRLQVSRCTRDDPANAVETIGAVGQRHSRLERQAVEF